MGFTTGFLGGLTLTYSLLYLTLYLHRTNRSYQHTLLSQQSLLLNSLLDNNNPNTTLSPAAGRPRYRVDPDTFDVEDRSSKKQGLVEMLKERWNAEVEGMVRKVEQTDWDDVRERWERRGVNLWRNLTRD